MAVIWSDGFEDGDVSEWTVNNFSASSSRSNSGSWSGYSNNAQSNTYQAFIEPSEISGGLEATGFRFYWNETSNSFGGGIRLLNSNGNVEVGLATNNPQWDIDDGNGVSSPGSTGSYNTWVLFDITSFDWSSGTFDIHMDGGGSTYTDSGRPLKQGVDIERIQIENYTAGGWQSSGSTDMWFDDIEVLGSTTPSPPSSLSGIFTENIDVDLTWSDNADNEDGFNVYRSTTSSPSFPGDYSDIADISANSTSYTDQTPPENQVVHYAVTAYNSDGESSETTDTVETGYVSGSVEVSGSALDGAEIHVIDDTNGSIEGSDTTDSSGMYFVSSSIGITVHVLCEYDDGVDQYTFRSKPFVVI